MFKVFKKEVFVTVVFGALAVGIAGCSSFSKDEGRNDDRSAAERAAAPESISPVTKSVAQREEAHAFSEIKFSRGSAQLTAPATEKLNTLMANAEKTGRSIDEVMVIAWGDEELPSNKMGKLSKAQQDLAEKRTKTVSDYMKGRHSGLDVDAYNMARQPNLFQKWFNTEDARLKNAFISAGLPTTSDGLKTPSKANHAVVFIKLND